MSPTEEADARTYFTEAEWSSMVPIEKNRVNNVVRNYNCLLSQGINARPPDFIVKYENRKKQEQTSSQLCKSEANFVQSSQSNSNSDESQGHTSYDTFQEGDLGSLSPDNEVLKESGYWGDASSDFIENFINFCQYCYIIKLMKHEDSENKAPSSGGRFVKTKSKAHPLNDQSCNSCSCGCQPQTKTQVTLHDYNNQSCSNCLCEYQSAAKTQVPLLSDDNSQSCSSCSCGCQSPAKTLTPLLTDNHKADLHCQECGQKFAKLKYLKNHIKRFSIPGENRPYKCLFCSHSFVHEKNRKFHERVHNSKLIPCCHCTKNFKDVASVRIHIQEAHHNRAHMCNECGIYYSTSSHLQRHKREVRKAYPHQCSVCGHRYANAVSLSRHEFQHTRVKSVECCICQKTFSSKTQLKNHLKFRNTKKKYECLSCKVKFLAQKSLKKHERLFNGDRPFKCTICRHAYNTKPRLTTHMKVHYKDKQHKRRKQIL